MNLKGLLGFEFADGFKPIPNGRNDVKKGRKIAFRIAKSLVW